MKYSILYNFEKEDQLTSAPNYYKAFGNYQNNRIGQSAKFIESRKTIGRYGTLFLIFEIITKHQDSDIYIGWLRNGIIAGVLNSCGLIKGEVKIILYNSDFTSQTLRTSLKLLFLKTLLKKNKIYFLSNKQVREFKNLTKSDNVKFLKYGVDLEFYKTFHFNKKQKSETNKLKAIVIGSAMRDLNILEGLSHFPSLEIIKTCINLNMSKDSHKIEKIGSLEITTYFNLNYEKYLEKVLNSDIVIIPVNSKYAPVGLTSLLECLALGKIVFISKGCSSEDYISDGLNGFTFKCQSELEEKLTIYCRMSTEEKTSMERQIDKTIKEFSLHKCFSYFYD